MSDLAYTIAQTDLSNATKQQLKNFVKAIRESWGKMIDLRKASEVALRQYLEDYLTEQATQVEKVTPPKEVTPTEITEIETVNEAPALSDFEGIDYETMLYTDTMAATPLTCDPCNFQYCKLPQLEKPPSFNEHTECAIAILLEFGTAYGNQIDSGWIAGILRDCSWRSTIPNRLTEKLILSDPIFYGLAGHSIETIGLFNRIVRSPEEFADIPQDMQGGAKFYQNIGGLLGGEAVSAICQYHLIRDNLGYLQQLHGISSLDKRTSAIRDRLFEYWDYNDQMMLLPSDRAQLKAEVPRIVDYFFSLIDGYGLYREMDDESLELLSKTDWQALISTAEYCWLHSESYAWEPLPNGGYRGYSAAKCEPDCISLSFNAWDEENNCFSSFFRIRAEHPDPMRRPWLLAS